MSSAYSPQMRRDLEQMLRAFSPDELALFAAALDPHPGPARELVQAEVRRRRARAAPWYRRLWLRLRPRPATAKIIPLYPTTT